MRKNKRFGSFENLEDRRVLDSTVVFNEIMYHPADGSDSLEFVELHNQMAVDMDISKWRLDDGIEFTFPEGTIVPGGAYLVIAGDPDALSRVAGIEAMGPYRGRLSNGGENLLLYDRNDRRMDSIDFEDAGKWPSAPDGNGVSLAKENQNSLSSRADNWTSSYLVGGTPGQPNFESVATMGDDIIVDLFKFDDPWSFQDTGTDLGESWRQAGFNDQNWSAGPGPFYAGSAQIDGVDLVPLEGVSASASSELSGHLASHTVDGSGLKNDTHVISPSLGTMWQTNGTFFGLDPDRDPEITFDLGEAKTINSMKVWNYNNVDTDTCCLARGIALADILIAGADGQFTTLIENQPFEIAPGVESDFSQDIELGDVEARFVKIDVDTTNGVANHGDVFDFVGLSEVQFLGLPAAGNTETRIGPTTHYFRKEFEFHQAPSRTELSLDLLIDDGAVVYLNGTEIYRYNMPEGEIGFQTPALFPFEKANQVSGIILNGDALVSGTNVIAVEVHQSSAQPDDDMVFAMSLTSTTTPPVPFTPDSIPLAINEIAGSTSGGDFFVELSNNSSQEVGLDGFLLAAGDLRHRFEAGSSIGANNVLSVAFASAPALQSHVTLFNSDETMAFDSEQVQEKGIGAAPDSTQLLITSVATPGAENQFSLENDVVINEIMYHHPPEIASPGLPPSFDFTNYLNYDAVWRYNDKGDDLPPDWYLTTHQVGGNWSSGPGLIGFESSALPSPGINTVSEDPRVLDTITMYFQTEIELSAAQLADSELIQMQHIVDDAAVFYVNGTEVERFNLDEGPIDSETRSNASVTNATVSEPVEIPISVFREGSNQFAVEVHNRSPGSSDIVFGMRLQSGVQRDSGVPPTPYQKIDEEWIEIYNKGNDPIDLSGWSLADAVEYDFVAGQTIQPDQYLLIARDADAFVNKFPQLEAQLIGEFTGSLGNDTDRIALLNQDGNPADVVEYFENGEWPAAADGKGSSLELRDPNADNATGLAWDASQSSPQNEWQSYSYQGMTGASPIGPDGQWQEFVMGLLSDGEVLIDDLSIIKEPSGEAVNVLQNGSFEEDVVGAHPAGWRLIGNHRHSEVIVDPDDPQNQVLRFVATSATEHMHNHAETTLQENGSIHRINNGVEYEISYKAKWVAGSNQLNTRLYFNRLPRTTILDRSDRHGTPGTTNSTVVSNLGPTYRDFIHSPAIPDVNEPIIVSVSAEDMDSIQDINLWYRVDKAAWTSTAMSVENNKYEAVIPGQDRGDIVQFYVEGTDGLGNSTTFPRRGRDSRALFRVNNNLTSDTGLHNLHLVVSPEDAEFLHSEVELMSNDELGATFIYNESEIFYDANLRLSGSERARPVTARLAFRIGFNSDHLFRGVHNGITIDRSESTGFGQREHIYHHGMNHSGGLPSEYNDLFNIITPLRAHTGSAEAQLARYSDIFLDEQYVNGSSGQLYEYELTYYPTSALGGPEGRKRPNPDGTDGVPISYLGDDKESFRWAFLNKNNRAQDDYSQFMEFTKVFETSGSTFNDRIGEVIDVDQWLRAFAFSVITGHGDNYGADGSQHNLQLYVRPSDDRVLFFPHDLDAFFQLTRPLAANSDLRKLMRVPEREHMYYGHVHDMIQTTFNQEYMERWTDHFRDLIPSQRFDRHLSDLVARSDYLITQIERAAAPVDFSVTAPDAPVDTPFANLQGRGWVNVREIRLAGSQVPIPVTWTDETTWETTIALGNGQNELTFEAYDFQGEKIAAQTVSITSTATNPVAESVVISEFNYNPYEPTAAELASNSNLENDDFEFIEFTNIGNDPINLLGVSLVSGIAFTFPSLVLSSGESTVVVKDAAAFSLRYGNDLSIAGEFESGQLSNSGERITLAEAIGETIVDFVYSDNDPWPIRADGAGASLELADPSNTTNAEMKYYGWQGSDQYGGTPGTVGETHAPTVVINEVLANSDTPAVDSIELYNASNATVDLSGWYLSDDQDQPLKYRFPDATTILPNEYLVVDERSFNPTPQNPAENHFALSASAGDQVWLVSVTDEGQIDSFVDDVTFDGTLTGQTLGRFPNGTGRLAPMDSNTLGATNSVPIRPNFVVTEIQYNPGSPSPAALEIDVSLLSDDLEFLEITNQSNATASLNGWRLRSAVDFDFANLEIGSGQSLVVVPFDPENATRLEAFRVHYGIDDAVTVVGPYSNQLDNDVEKIEFKQPGLPPFDVGIYGLVEEIIYDDVAPWPTDADGTGQSLVRIANATYGNLPQNWASSAPTPGTTPGKAPDLNADGLINSDDVDLLCESLHQEDQEFDLNADGTFDFDDIDFYVRDLLGTQFGDSNVDGVFNSRDLVLVFQAGKFENEIEDDATWSTGDWNCDGDFTTRDLVLAFQSGGYVAASKIEA